jgi:phospholipid/cholesterol/gamma-HCH transport system substrate-binding protein
MSKTQLEWKVGLFVIISLGLLGALLIQFSKGTTFWRKTYHINLRSGNVSGMKPRAQVLMAGVQVGSVSDIKLGAGGTNVTITLTVYREYQIPKSSDFSIEQAGFLGDQYVSVTPRPSTNAVFEYLQEGDTVVANAPWTLLGVANRVLTSLANFDEAAGSLRQTIDTVRQGAFSEQTLSNFSVTVWNLRQASAQAAVTLSNLDALIITNGPAIYSSGTNLATTLSNANGVVLSARSLIESNRPAIEHSVSNLQSATHRLDDLVADVQNGEGLAGKLLKDEKMAAKMSEIVTDLGVTSSNLNQIGLWRVLFPKNRSAPAAKRKSSSSEALTSPKDRP